MPRKKTAGRRSRGLSLWEILIVIFVFLAMGGGSIVTTNVQLSPFSDLTSTDIALIFAGVFVLYLLVRVFIIGRSHRMNFASRILHISNLNDILAMSPGEFEQFVTSLFTYNGFEAKTVGKSGDNGIDVDIWKHHQSGKEHIVAQCKRYSLTNHVGEPEIRNFYGSFVDTASQGYFVTTSSFTDPARSWAASRPIHLIDGQRLLQWTEETAKAIAKRQ